MELHKFEKKKPDRKQSRRRLCCPLSSSRRPSLGRMVNTPVSP